MNNPLKVVRVLGGLGNQMFQVAYAHWVQQQHPSFQVFCDTTDFKSYGLHQGYLIERVFNHKVNIAEAKELRMIGADSSSFIFRIRRKLNIPRPYYLEEKEEERFLFHPDWINNQHQYLDGYWQCRQYVESVKNIKELFQFSAFTDQENLSLEQTIRGAQHSVSMHVRRGDYVTHPKYNNICTLDYYQNALNALSSRLGPLTVFIFSDDIEWCKAHFQGEQFVHVSHNKGIYSFCDLHLMSLCQHHIIANSSFSWWGAYLGRESGWVMGPKKWKNNMVGTRDLFPENWIHL